MERIDLNGLRRDYRGRTYAELIEHHIRRQSRAELYKAALGTARMLPAATVPLMTAAVDEWNETARYSDFWKSDAAETFDLMLETGRRVLELSGLEPRDEDLFNVFQVLVLTHSEFASQHREVRKFAGIRKGLLG